MLFNSGIFLFIFLPSTLFFYFIVPKKWRNGTLALASYIFYGYLNVEFIALLLFSTCFNFYFGKKIHESILQSDRRNFLILSLLLNLALLIFFKYTNFFLENFKEVFPFLNIPRFDIVLPLGISFITFHGMSYTLDIYKEKIAPKGGFLDFVCYFSMFPHLIAGPIVRFSQIAGQLIERHFDLDRICLGIRLFILGLAGKVIFADSMAYIADQQLGFPSLSFWSVWIGMAAFSLQIYFDFSGYSNMAIGLGKLFGFDLPENFNYPYQARGISDFWRRWHMTLSAWLRDYLYIPLGGSKIPGYRWLINILVTFLLCGLWHGASWTFVLWGGYHGLLIVLERPFRKKIQLLPVWIVIPLTNILVIFGWVFFRAETTRQAGSWVGAMTDLPSAFQFSQNVPPGIFIFFLLGLQFSCWINPLKVERMTSGTFLTDAGLIVLFILCIVVVQGIEVSPFLYYQF